MRRQPQFKLKFKNISDLLQLNKGSIERNKNEI